MRGYRVFVRLDDKKNIVEVQSSAFIENYDGWILIDEGFGVKYHHAQGNYFPKSVINENGAFRYRLENGKVIEKTEADCFEEEKAFRKRIIRARRIDECFPIVNRGQLWYDGLTQEQKSELRSWYQGWLDAPETDEIPTLPQFVKI